MNVPDRDESRSTAQRWSALGLGIGGGTVLVVLLARTAVGAVDRQLGSLTIAALATVGFAVAMSVWRLGDLAAEHDTPQRRAARAAIALLSGLLFGLLVARDSLPGVVSVVVNALIWSIAAAVRIRPIAGLRLWTSILARTGEAPAAAAAQYDVPRAASAETAAGTVAASAWDRRSDDAALQMQFRRLRTDDGETIELHARLTFAPGAREAALHVPFWPALDSLPEVECEPLDGDDVEFRVTSAERYGVRIEARLPGAAVTERALLIGVEIRSICDASERSAAA